MRSKGVEVVAVWGSQAADPCVYPQASFLDGRVQCHAYHLLWISGASCKVPVVPLAHSPPWDGAHIAGRMGVFLEKGQSGDLRTCPLSLWSLSPRFLPPERGQVTSLP